MDSEIVVKEETIENLPLNNNTTIEDDKPKISDLNTEVKEQKSTIDLGNQSPKEVKPNINEINKSSMEILSELFSSFDAEPPVIIKKEKKEKKSKKKHKHKEKDKEKKHKKKDKKHKANDEKSNIDLAQLLIKQEKELTENKIKIEGTDLSLKINFNNCRTNEKEDEDKSDEKSSDEVSKKNGNKIDINVNFNSIRDALKRKIDDADLSECDSSLSNEGHKSKKKKKHKSKDKSKKEHRSRSRDKSSKRDESHKKSRREHESTYKDDNLYKRRDRSYERDYKSKDKDKYKDYSRKDSRDRDNDFYKPRDYDSDRDDRWKDRTRSYGINSKDRKRRERSRSKEDSSHIDKKKLLEIARKNAIQMMKSGSLPGALTLGPQAQEKMIAAIKAGGKTIEELTDFCKTLSRKEELGEISSVSDEKGSDSETDRLHHPFQIKERPTSITMNIKNSVPLPTKTTQERTTELRMQFPVSSGQHHRKNENEWVPVTTKKSEPAAPKPVAPVVQKKPTIEPPVVVPAEPPPETTTEQQVDISSVVSQRLTAIRKLQENPNDVQALSEMYKSNKEMQTWAQSKQQLGQFTGSTGAQILSQAELSAGYQAWAKKDQLQNTTPVSGGMGMHLLQKMGWKPGEGLGKEKTGALEPLLLEVKLDKKGLVANEEQKKKKQKHTQNQWNLSIIQGKHPVSLLGEYASKMKLGAPQYTLCFECGPDHKKNFLFKVILDDIEYKPNVASPNKKEAKAAAATVCLQQIGLISPTAPPSTPV